MIEPKHSNTRTLPLSHSQNKVAVNMRKYRKDHPEYVAKSRERNRQLRFNLMDLLGERKYARCGYSEDVRALHIGHRTGGGYLQRRRMTMNQIYRFYLRNQDLAKVDLQIICANCNTIQQADRKEFSWLKNRNVEKQ